MKGIFNNIYFVSALALIALAYVLYTVSPVIFKQSETDFVDNEVVDPLAEPILANESSEYTASHIAENLDDYNIDWSVYPKRNPFVAKQSTQIIIQPKAVVEKPKNNTIIKDKDLVLHAIIVNNQHRLAVLNNNVVSIGQTIDSYKVTSIEPHFIEIKNNLGSKKLVIHEALYEN